MFYICVSINFKWLENMILVLTGTLTLIRWHNMMVPCPCGWLPLPVSAYRNYVVRCSVDTRHSVVRIICGQGSRSRNALLYHSMYLSFNKRKIRIECNNADSALSKCCQDSRILVSSSKRVNAHMLKVQINNKFEIAYNISQFISINFFYIL